ncbi:MAG: coniferyl aldehyde dehydrogenase [Hydrocarboniphaga sp.]|uniref:coniferyl aldehyde dehydrogenase n=1 Tax=Hydrocarboniphaga sp. TaxID=2033016 RepID=UPI002635979D|nr:coniferyl aldehyde dehydrogenase [Hydrocarboniphaga sp.]MDB5969941.1 coniferyl aldehyde dehydrogenase [Hydrocarboniphaga sp.]
MQTVAYAVAASSQSVEAPAQDSLRSALAAQRHAFNLAPFPDLAHRKADLDRLEKVLVSHSAEIVSALSQDFGGRSEQEAVLSEVIVTLNNLRYTRRRLGRWMKPRKRHVPLELGSGRAYVLPQPLGIVGIVSPWNFPVQLSLVPLIGALAAGNRAMIKPSELSPLTSDVIRKLVAEAFPPEQVVVCPGDVDVARTFVALPFDHLVYTGSTDVGRHVMRVAADNLVPVTLELGGKSPALVAPDAVVLEAAKDIVFGKLLNAGQICISPDYALVPRALVKEFARACQQVAQQMFPEGTASGDYTSIINQRHLGRLESYLSAARASGTEIVSLFAADKISPVSRKLAPVLAIDPADDSALMQNEVFGPILSIKPYDSLDDAIAFINSRPRPLALYLFTRSSATIDRVMKRTVCGSVSINDTLVHCAVEDLPFGGVGASGMGHYHGPEGFETLSKMKPIFHRKGFRTDRFARPPFTTFKKWLISRLI